MRIKKIIANSMKEGREIIERELGSEAIILSHRNAKLPSGATVIEFVAALDTNENKNTFSTTSPTDNGSAYSGSSSNSNSNYIGHANNNSTGSGGGISELYENSSIFSRGRARNTSGLSNSIDNELLLKVVSDLSTLKEITSSLADNIKYKYTGTMSEALSNVYKILRNSDISEEFALELIGYASAKGTHNDYKSTLAEVQKRILDKFQFANPIKVSPVRQIISFYGATGGGKTTSLIKLAIIYKLLHKSKVLIVSADTHKVGGVEQLQTLASISGIAFATAYQPEELREIIKNESNYDLILIDTAGCNPNNLEDISSLLEYHKAAVPDLRFLVLSATNSESSIKNTINKFSNFEITSCIITKVDEAIGLGNVISALEQTVMPMSYFTTGTKIPDDLELANKDKLYEYLLIV